MHEHLDDRVSAQVLDGDAVEARRRAALVWASHAGVCRCRPAARRVASAEWPPPPRDGGRHFKLLFCRRELHSTGTKNLVFALPNALWMAVSMFWWRLWLNRSLRSKSHRRVACRNFFCYVSIWRTHLKAELWLLSAIDRNHSPSCTSILTCSCCSKARSIKLYGMFWLRAIFVGD